MDYERGVLLPLGGGLPPPLAHLLGPAGLPLAPLYTGAGAPLNTQVDLLISPSVCGAPSTVFHLGHIVAVLRRSPASVEHQDHHHAVVLTELSLPEALLDLEFEGHHRDEHVQIAEVSCIWYMDQLDREDVRLHQPRY